MSSANYDYSEEMERERQVRLIEDKQRAVDNAFDEYEEAARDGMNPRRIAKAEQRFMRLREQLDHMLSSSAADYL